MKSKYIDLKNDNDYTKIKPAAESIKQGKLVLFPTETVYGIGVAGKKTVMSNWYKPCLIMLIAENVLLWLIR